MTSPPPPPPPEVTAPPPPPDDVPPPPPSINDVEVASESSQPSIPSKKKAGWGAVKGRTPLSVEELLKKKKLADDEASKVRYGHPISWILDLQTH
jgi:ATP-dependent RNA helicase DDX23/PRP28